MAFLLFAILSVFVSYVSSGKVLICYYGSWASKREGNGNLTLEHVNPKLCTHLVYSFVGLDTNSNVKSLQSGLDKRNFKKLYALKHKNRKLKTLLAVGGWNGGSGNFSKMAANPTLRQNFILSALKMTLDNGFDGFDLDWEYPGQRDTAYGVDDINNFSLLVKELKEAFMSHSLLLTAAVSATEASQSYDIAEISKYLDYISIMAYDMHGSSESVTGHNAPLFGGDGDKNTVDQAVQYWLRKGCPANKLVIGLSLYARSFTLASADNSEVGAPAVGAGIQGPFTATSGTLGYNEFCYMLKTQSWEVKYDNLAQVPYAVQDTNWVSFDDPASITKKVEYGIKYNVAGFMVWSIETDDFHGLCSGKDFPILRAINKAKHKSRIYK